MAPKYVYLMWIVAGLAIGNMLMKSKENNTRVVGALMKIATWIAMWVGIIIMFSRF